jgi:hypothetical protein
MSFIFDYFHLQIYRHLPQFYTYFHQPPPRYVRPGSSKNRRGCTLNIFLNKKIYISSFYKNCPPRYVLSVHIQNTDIY